MYSIIPKPLNIKYYKNIFLTLKNECDFSSDFPKSRELAKIYLNNFFNIKLIDKSIYPSGDYFLSINRNKNLSEEEYTLEITSHRIIINSSSDFGSINAIKTLVQILNQSKNNVLSGLFIQDKPYLKRRGFMLDVSRHFLNKDELLKFLEAASMFKYNVFHFHLSDDQGFRIESKKYPNLHLIGSKRKETMKDGKEYSGYYTQEEIKEIVEFCSIRGIEVVPEIDLPAHTNAMIAAYNELGVFIPKDFEVSTRWGLKADLICSWKEEVYEFIFNLFDELITLFPSKYFHIGGDEANKTKWAHSEECNSKMKELGIKTYMDMQGYFSNRLIKFLNSKNKIPILWNDILKANNLKGDYVIQHWTHKPNEEYINAGGKIIYSQCPSLYLDYPTGITSMKKTYNLTIQNDIIPEKNLIGAEACIWTEYLKNYSEICNYSFPRLISISENFWSIEKNYNDFKLRLKTTFSLLDKLGIINYTKNFRNLDPNIFKIIKQAFNFRIRCQHLLRDSAKNWRNLIKTDKIILD